MVTRVRSWWAKHPLISATVVVMVAAVALLAWRLAPVEADTVLLHPNAETSNTQWTPAGSTPAALASTNGTYATHSNRNNAGQLDLAIEDSALSGSIASVDMVVVAYSSNGARALSLTPMLGATAGTVQTINSLPNLPVTTYTFSAITKPGGGSWSWADINNLGVRLSCAAAGTGNPAIGVDEIFFRVNYAPPTTEITVASVGQPAGRFVTQGSTHLVDGLSLALTGGTGTRTVSSVTIRNTGTSPAANVSRIHVYLDDGDAAYDAGDSALTGGGVAVTGPDTVVPITPQSVGTGTPVRLWVVYEFASGAANAAWANSKVVTVAHDATTLVNNTATGNTFTVDAVAPTVSSASAPDATTVDVVFSEELDASSLSLADFAVNNGLTVSAVSLLADNKTVRLTTSVQTPGQSYTVTCGIGSVRDRAGNVSAAPNTAVFTGWGTVTLRIASANQPSGGYVASDVYVWTDSFTAELLGAGTRYLQGVTVRGPAGVGSTIAGVWVWKDDGDGVRDAGDTLMNATGAAFAGTDALVTFDAQQPVTSSVSQYWVSYFVSNAAATGATFSSRIVGATHTAAALTNIAVAGPTFTVDKTGPAIAVTAPASNATLTSILPYTIVGTASDAASGLSTVSVGIQRGSDGRWWNALASAWQAGPVYNEQGAAANWTFSWAFEPASQNGTETYTINARAIDVLGNVGNATPVTNVRVDNMGPRVDSAAAIDATHVDVVFDESLSAGTVASGDFAIAGLTVSAAVLQADGRTVRLTTSAQTGGQAYTATCTLGSVQDVAGNASVAPNTANFVGFGSGATLTVAQGTDSGRPTEATKVMRGTVAAVDQLALSAAGGPVTVSSITVRGLDTLDTLTIDVSLVRLLVDDGDGVYDAGDTVGATGTFSAAASGSPVTFAGLDYTVASGTTTKLWIVYTIGGSALNAHKVGSRLESGDVVASVGNVSPFAPIVSADAGQTFEIDSLGPSVVSASAPDATHFDVVFTESLASASIHAIDFSVAGLTVSAAALQPDNRTVRLTTSAQTSGQAYTVSVGLGTLTDATGNGNISPNTANFTGFTAADTQAPSVPSGVSASAGTTGTVAVVTWTASTDNVGVTGYRIYRATAAGGPFLWIGNAAASPFSDTTGATQTDYWYKVSAVDAAGNESALSSAFGPVRSTWSVSSPHTSYVGTDMCNLCHAPHEASTASNIFKNVGAGVGEMPVCLQCHDGTGSTTDIKSIFTRASGHAVEGLATGGDLTNACSGCHGPHKDNASRKDLWRGTVNGVSVPAPDNRWCLACHDDANSWYGAGYPAMSSPTRDASGYPTVGTFPGASVYNNVARNRHSLIPTQAAGQSLGDCRLCHASHRSATTYDSLLATYSPPATATLAAERASGSFAASCLACHGGQPSWVATGAADIKKHITFDAANNAASAGHRIKTAGGTLPVGAPLPCYDCHNPHGSATGNKYLISDERWSGVGDTTATPAASRAFCLGCHVTSDSRDGLGNVLAASDTARLVEGLPKVPSAKPANLLKLPALGGGDAHSFAAAQSCHDCHGRDYAVAGSYNVHNPGPGVSAGGIACYACHSTYRDAMEDASGTVVGATRKNTYHHVLGGLFNATGSIYEGDYAPGPTGAYPQTTHNGQDFFCVTCHVDHDKFNSNRGANLRRSSASAVQTTMATDYDASIQNGVCWGCHSSFRYPKDNANHRDDGVATMTAKVSSNWPDSAHQYSVDSSYGPLPGDTYSANCVKCHNDDAAKDFQTSQAKFGTHYSAARRLLSAFGAPVQEWMGQEHCFGCHSKAPFRKSVAGKDAYGSAGASMTLPAEGTRRAFNLGGSSHPVTETANGSVECVSCHNPHTVSKDATVNDPFNTYISTPYLDVSSQTTFCFKCHSGGSLPTYKNTATPDAYVPATVTISPADALDMNKYLYPTQNHWTADGSFDNNTVKACGACHDKHGSKWPSLLGVYQSATDTSTINGQALTGNDASVCRACHTTAGEGYPSANPTLASIDLYEQARTPSGYFSPAASPGWRTIQWPGWTTWTNLTTSKHFNTAATYNGKNVNDCKQCHDVHGTANAYDELTATFNDSNFTLCLNCHNGVVSSPNLRVYYKPAAGGSDGSAPNAGHVIKTAVPGSKLAVGDPIPCYDCHQPHGSANGNSYMLSDQRWKGLADTKVDAASNRKLCLGCHVTSDGRDGNGTALAASDTTNLFEGMPRNPADVVTYGSGLQLPALGGANAHGSASAQACFDCHGKDYAGAATNNVHNPSDGVSAGGTACYNCHSPYQSPMEDNAGSKSGATRASAYHHVLGGAAGDGDIAPNAGLYPTIPTDVYCVSCHTDHNYFNSNKAANLRTSATDSSVVRSNTDYIGATAPYGVCVSCHGGSLTKQNPGVDQRSDGSTSTPRIVGGTGANGYGNSAHNYTANGGYSDTTTFLANCSKCHTDEQTKEYQTSANKFGTHWSDTRRLLSALGGTVVDPQAERACYRCHSETTDAIGGTRKAANGSDWYGAGAMTLPGTEKVYKQFQLASKHPVAGSPDGSVECESCHNVHVVSKTAGQRVTDPDDGYSIMAYGTVDQDVAFCKRCHDGGTLPTYGVSTSAYVPATVSLAASVTAADNKATYEARAHWTASGSISSAERQSCADCHDNHGSAAPYLLGVYQPASGTNTLGAYTITANDNTVCRACHDAASATFPATPSKNASGYPMDGTFSGFTRYNDATYGIHRTGRTGVVYPGTSYATGDCKNCHDVHGTAFQFDETVADYSPSNFKLCFDCHDSDGPAATTRNIRQFYPTTAGGAAVQTATSRFGHKTKTPGKLPAGSALPCYDCHNPHGGWSADGLLLVSPRSAAATDVIGDAVGEIDLSTPWGVRRFCLGCHTTADATSYGWSGTATITVSAGAQIEGIDRTVYDSTNKRGLKLPPVTGHYNANTHNCYQCHGNDYAVGGYNVHNPTGGVSPGGVACYACHSSYNVMTNSPLSFHHVLDYPAGSGGADVAPNTGAYPSSDNQIACVSCHTDHNYFNSNKGANLRQGIGLAGSAVTNSDYVGVSPYGICISCHRLEQDKSSAQQSGGSTRTPVIDGAGYAASKHNYGYTVTYGSSTFESNCSKCHDDEQDANSYQGQTYKIGTHFSAENRMLKALGVALVGATSASEENLCYRCHTGSGAGNDMYNESSMTAGARGIQTQFTKATLKSKHNVAGYQGIHRADEYNAAPTQVAPATTTGWWGTGPGFTTKHVECEDCHNVHEAQANTYQFPNTDVTTDPAYRPRDTVPAVSGANKGVWGVNISGAVAGKWTGSGTLGAPGQPTYDKISDVAYEWQLCLKCHSRYAWGSSTPPNVPSGQLAATAIQPSTTNAAGAMTDVGKDFNPMNYAYHPVFQKGANQPSGTMYSAVWDNDTSRRDVNGAAAGGTTGNLLSNTFVDGWYQDSITVCSDCHNNDSWAGTDSSGPHGSANKWLLRGIDTGIKVTTVSGPITNAGNYAGGFCLNCHRADVYGDGQGDPVNSSGNALSRLSHLGSDINGACHDLPPGSMPNDCYNCHGGRSNDGVSVSGALHGSSMGKGDGTNNLVGGVYRVQDGALIGDEMGKRFMNGATWDAHTTGIGSSSSNAATCYTLNNDDYLGQCNKHSNVGATPNYAY